VLKVMIRDPNAARFGYWQISTSSIGNYTHFLSVWDVITDGGHFDVAMNRVPFILRVVPQGTLYQDSKTGMWNAKENFFLQLEVAPAVARAKQLDGERRFMAALEGREIAEPPKLTAPDIEIEEPEGAEEPAPPPWAGVDEGSEEPPEVEGEPVEELPAPIEYVEPPADLDRGNFLVQAVDLPGYGNLGAVKNAMLQLYGNGWEVDNWTPAGAWRQLQEHRQAP